MRIERGLVLVDRGDVTDFWRIRCMSLRAEWHSTELPSLSFALIFGKLFAFFLCRFGVVFGSLIYGYMTDENFDFHVS